MYSHKPKDYECPFCRIVSGKEKQNKGTKQEDIVYQNKYVTAFIANKWWPNNKGHVLVVPNDHFENIYELPKEMAAEIHEVAQLVSYAMKDAYDCDGISTRQHNEPAGNQDVWHYHLHVYPRYEHDNLYMTKGRYTEPEERPFFAKKLKSWFDTNSKSTGGNHD